jgi:hypothetical protein
VIVGGSASRTVTENAQVLLLPDRSTAVQKTVLVPGTKFEPLGGSQVTATPSQLSVADERKSTVALQLPGGGLVRMAAGQAMRGSSRSSTVTVKLQVTLLLVASTAMQCTAVVPRPNLLPLGGAHTVTAAEQSSVAVAAKVTSASHRAVSVTVTMFVGHVKAGGCAS